MAAASLSLVGGTAREALVVRAEQLAALVERGQLGPHVGASYALADIALAHARLESRDNGLRGKVAIAIIPAKDSDAHAGLP